jgi:hypothetical protein
MHHPHGCLVKNRTFWVHCSAPAPLKGGLLQGTAGDGMFFADLGLSKENPVRNRPFQGGHRAWNSGRCVQAVSPGDGRGLKKHDANDIF